MNDEPPRIGLGQDLHRLVEGRRCVLGGVEFDAAVGPVGHSDGDVVLHALTDAILGAAGLEDLGTLFRNDDPRFKDAASDRFLAEALVRIGTRNLRVASADIVVHCDRPAIAPERPAILARLSGLLGCAPDRINIKGKSLEGTGGGHETIAATAVVLLTAIKTPD